MEPIKLLLVLLGIMIVSGIVIITVWNMISSHKEVRTGALIIVAQIKQKSPIFGGALEAFVRTFVWF